MHAIRLGSTMIFFKAWETSDCAFLIYTDLLHIQTFTHLQIGSSYKISIYRSHYRVSGIIIVPFPHFFLSLLLEQSLTALFLTKSKFSPLSSKFNIIIVFYFFLFPSLLRFLFCCLANFWGKKRFCCRLSSLFIAG